MADTARYSVSVAAAIVRDDGRILAIRRRDNGHWEPSGGILELAETIEESLIREVREETGLTVKTERLTGVYKNMTHGIVAVVYRCHVVNGTARPTAEASETAWLSADEVLTHMSEASPSACSTPLKPPRADLGRAATTACAFSFARPGSAARLSYPNTTRAAVRRSRGTGHPRPRAVAAAGSILLVTILCTPSSSSS